MGSFRVIIGILHYMGLYSQLNAASKPAVPAEVDNHISGNAVFTEVPHDITTQRGQDVEMACSFRGAGPSYSLEIQWWYMKNHRDWPEKPTWTTNQVVPMEMSKDAAKISVVKVAGSNISHKLRLSNIKRSDEGTYECRVIDFSGSVAQHHRVRAYLQVEAERSLGHISADTLPQEPRHRGQGSQSDLHQTEGRELKRRSADDSTTDCTESCVL
ncbi:V-set and transmembrane domain-containing protein 2-like protein [Oncorhynchus tshawytscha]|uniref:Ig-like domain-containing protein n=1 Tax=Oncorhynchus tshawytscha TaxID=74940 RepID=A0A8C8FUI6_ONCTS|nr:V-set and transmembrane domain-containing protein 2-like protein [Oncorhynchus tshawytscha]